jgi:hypothetical protein
MFRLSAFLTLAVGAVAIDNNWDGFVHFKNWNGAVPTNVPENQPFTTGAGFPINIRKDMCAADSACKAMSGSSVPNFGTFLDVGGVTNTTYDMFLGTKANEHNLQYAPAAMCTVESGGGNLPDVKWLACANDFDFGGTHGIDPSHILVSYNIPPEQIHTACLQNPKCVGFRLKNDASGGDILGRNGNSHGWFKMP